MLYHLGGLKQAQPSQVIQSNLSSPQQQVKVDEVARTTISGGACNFLKGLCRSKVFQAVMITAAALVLIFALVSNPVGWIVSALHVSMAVAILIIGGAALALTWINYKLLNSCCSAGTGSDSIGSPASSRADSPVGFMEFDDADSPPPDLSQLRKRAISVPADRDEVHLRPSLQHPTASEVDAELEKMLATVPKPKPRPVGDPPRFSQLFKREPPAPTMRYIKAYSGPVKEIDHTRELRKLIAPKKGWSSRATTEWYPQGTKSKRALQPNPDS